MMEKLKDLREFFLMLHSEIPLDLSNINKALSLFPLAGEMKGEIKQELQMILELIRKLTSDQIDRQSSHISDLFDQKFINVLVEIEKSCCDTPTSDRPCIITDLMDTLSMLAETSVMTRSLIVTTFLEFFMSQCYRPDGDVTFKLDVLKNVNVTLEHCPTIVREKLIVSQSVTDQLFNVVKEIDNIGDYEVQVGVIEFLFRFIPRKMRQTTIQRLFTKPNIADAFICITDVDFETDCRVFLNKLNSTLQPQSRVYSFPCSRVTVGDIDLKKPSDVKYTDFWVDFNAGSGRLTVFCEQTVHVTLSQSEDLWETLSIWKHDIATFSTSAEASHWSLNLQLKSPSCVTLPTLCSQNDSSSVTIVFDRMLSAIIQNAINITFSTCESKPTKASVATLSLKVPCPGTSAAHTQSDTAHTPVRLKISMPCQPMSTPAGTTTDSTVSTLPRPTNTSRSLKKAPPQGTSNMSSVDSFARARSKSADVNSPRTPNNKRSNSTGKIKTPLQIETISSKKRASKKTTDPAIASKDTTKCSVSSSVTVYSSDCGNHQWRKKNVDLNHTLDFEKILEETRRKPAAPAAKLDVTSAHLQARGEHDRTSYANISMDLEQPSISFPTVNKSSELINKTNYTGPTSTTNEMGQHEKLQLLIADKYKAKQSEQPRADKYKAKQSEQLRVIDTEIDCVQEPGEMPQGDENSQKKKRGKRQKLANKPPPEPISQEKLSQFSENKPPIVVRSSQRIRSQRSLSQDSLESYGSVYSEDMHTVVESQEFVKPRPVKEARHVRGVARGTGRKGDGKKKESTEVDGVDDGVVSHAATSKKVDKLSRSRNKGVKNVGSESFKNDKNAGETLDSDKADGGTRVGGKVNRRKIINEDMTNATVLSKKDNIAHALPKINYQTDGTKSLSNESDNSKCNKLESQIINAQSDAKQKERSLDFGTSSHILPMISCNNAEDNTLKPNSAGEELIYKEGSQSVFEKEKIPRFVKDSLECDSITTQELLNKDEKGEAKVLDKTVEILSDKNGNTNILGNKVGKNKRSDNLTSKIGQDVDLQMDFRSSQRVSSRYNKYGKKKKSERRSKDKETTKAGFRDKSQKSKGRKQNKYGKNSREDNEHEMCDKMSKSISNKRKQRAKDLSDVEGIQQGKSSTMKKQEKANEIKLKDSDNKQKNKSRSRSCTDYDDNRLSYNTDINERMNNITNNKNKEPVKLNDRDSKKTKEANIPSDEKKYNNPSWLMARNSQPIKSNEQTDREQASHGSLNDTHTERISFLSNKQGLLLHRTTDYQIMTHYVDSVDDLSQSQTMSTLTQANVPPSQSKHKIMEIFKSRNQTSVLSFGNRMKSGITGVPKDPFVFEDDQSIVVSGKLSKRGMGDVRKDEVSEDNEVVVGGEMVGYDGDASTRDDRVVNKTTKIRGTPVSFAFDGFEDEVGESATDVQTDNDDDKRAEVGERMEMENAGLFVLENKVGEEKVRMRRKLANKNKQVSAAKRGDHGNTSDSLDCSEDESQGNERMDQGNNMTLTQARKSGKKKTFEKTSYLSNQRSLDNHLKDRQVGVGGHGDESGGDTVDDKSDLVVSSEKDSPENRTRENITKKNRFIEDEAKSSKTLEDNEDVRKYGRRYANKFGQIDRRNKFDTKKRSMTPDCAVSSTSRDLTEANVIGNEAKNDKNDEKLEGDESQKINIRGGNSADAGDIQVDRFRQICKVRGGYYARVRGDKLLLPPLAVITLFPIPSLLSISVHRSHLPTHEPTCTRSDHYDQKLDIVSESASKLPTSRSLRTKKVVNYTDNKDSDEDYTPEDMRISWENTPDKDGDTRSELSWIIHKKKKTPPRVTYAARDKVTYTARNGNISSEYPCSKDVPHSPVSVQCQLLFESLRKTHQSPLADLVSASVSKRRPRKKPAPPLKPITPVQNEANYDELDDEDLMYQTPAVHPPLSQQLNQSRDLAVPLDSDAPLTPDEEDNDNQLLPLISGPHRSCHIPHRLSLMSESDERSNDNDDHLITPIVQKNEKTTAISKPRKSQKSAGQIAVQSPKKSFKRKHSITLSSDDEMEVGQNEESARRYSQPAGLLQPRKLFKTDLPAPEAEYTQPSVFATNDCDTSLDFPGLNADSGVTGFLEAFSGDFSSKMQKKQTQLITMTTEVMQNTGKYMSGVLRGIHGGRNQLMTEFSDKMMVELVELEKDVEKLRAAEEECIVFYKRQLSVLQSCRKSQADRLASVRSLHSELDTDNQHMLQHECQKQNGVHSILKKELSALRNKLLQQSQHQEIVNVRNRMRSLFS